MGRSALQMCGVAFDRALYFSRHLIADKRGGWAHCQLGDDYPIERSPLPPFPVDHHDDFDDDGGPIVAFPLTESDRDCFDHLVDLFIETAECEQAAVGDCGEFLHRRVLDSVGFPFHRTVCFGVNTEFGHGVPPGG